jgi:uncharacterized protein (TIGR02680 family)
VTPYDDWEATEAVEASLPRFPLPDTTRWRPLRSGVIGIYKYDDQTFVWHRGKLLIRGLNGTGKSVVPEVQLPYIHEANVSAERISTFGGKDRSMHWKVIGHDETGRPNGRSYTWLEYGRLTAEGTPEYFTVGSGLSASKASRDSLQHWHFHTRQRVGLDLRLTRSHEPLSEKALAAAIGTEGGVYSRSDVAVFRSRVNSTLYGMTDEQYRQMNNMIHELRKPKLSDKLDLDKLSQLLSDALPTVAETAITPLADGFERLDRHAKDLQGLEEMTQAATELARLYRTYARRISRKRAADVRAATNAFDDVRRRQRFALTRMQELTQEREDIGIELTELEGTAAELSGRLDALKRRPEYEQGQQIEPAEQQAQQKREHADVLHSQLSAATARRDSARAQLAAAQARLQAATDAETAARSAAGSAAHTVGRASAHSSAVSSVNAVLAADSPTSNDLRPVRKALSDDVKARRAVVAAVKTAAATAAVAARALADARAETTKAVEALGRAEDELAEANTAVEAARDAYATAARWWASTLSEITVDLDAIDVTEPDVVRDATAAAASAARVGLAELRASVTETKTQRERERSRLQTAYDARASEPQPVRPTASRRTTPRVGRPGATMFELVQFASGAESAQLEAACEAIELLDAWVTPDGRVTAGDLDLFVTGAGAAVASRRLSSAVVVDAEAARAAGIDPAVVTAALDRVELADAAAEATHSVAVAHDGTWRVGPLAGTTAKDQVELIGAAARERTRQRQLRDLADRIAEEDRVVSQLAADLAILAGRDSTVDEERRGLPSPAAVIEARKALTIKAERRRGATEDVARRRKAEAEADDKARAEQETVRLLIDAHELADWATRLDQYDEAIIAWQDAFSDWLNTVGERIGQLNAVADKFVTHTEADAQAIATQTAHRAADLSALEAESRYQTLLDAVGAPFQRLKEEMAGVDAELRATGARRNELHDRQVAVAIEIGGSRTTLETVEADRATRLTERQAADVSLVALARRGVLAAAGFRDLLAAPTADATLDNADDDTDDDEQEPSDALGGHTHTAVLRAARHLDTTLDVPFEQSQVDQAQNRASQRRHELALALDSLRLSDGTDAGMYLITAIRGNREVTLPDLVALLSEEFAETQALLSAEEERLFSEFLTGQVRAEVVAKVRDATALVEEMNRNLQRVRTASGIRVQLDWKPRVDEEEGTQRVLKLLLRNPEDLYDADREQLLEFFRDRLRRVSTLADGDTYSRRLAKLLDYRAWFAFTVQWAKHDQKLEKLTRREHSALSGGEKAVTLHLPLFAAAAAYYHAASLACPRLIVLDEMFAGVDDELRGQLFELIVNFDLDLLATSERETGTHAELDGISVYQLVAYEGTSWILALRSMWDGERLLRAFEEELLEDDDADEAAAAADGTLPMPS